MLSKMLSDREREVLRLISRGLSNKQIARQLKLSPGTVAGYLRSIFDKVAAHNRSSLAAIWYERGGPSPAADDDALSN
jgi:two-component system nitrate/nitrite response regulator NarL